MKKLLLIAFMISHATVLHASDAILKNVFSALMSNDTALINSGLKTVSELSLSEKNACTGALLMKKAGLVTQPAEKLRLFKQGRHFLEEEIKSHPDKTLYRYLRLMIQENSPAMLGYKKNMQEDAALVRKHYKKLSAAVRESIADYAAQSHILKPSDLE